MALFNQLLAARLVAACDKYPWHDQVAQACGISYAGLKHLLLVGVTSPDQESPEAAFARDYYAADVALSRRIFYQLMHGRLELELEGIDLGDVSDDVYSKVDEYYGPILAGIAESAHKRPPRVVDGEPQPGAKLTLRLRSPTTPALWDWFNRRWPSFEHAQSIGHLLEAKSTKKLALSRSYEKPTPDQIEALSAAGWERRKDWAPGEALARLGRS